jgi:hypothetical protein
VETFRKCWGLAIRLTLSAETTAAQIDQFELFRRQRLNGDKPTKEHQEEQPPPEV